MPYMRSKCKAGTTTDYGYYYTIKYNNDSKESKRAKKEKPTKEAQKLVNKRKAEKTVTRLINANFSSNDYYVTFTYQKNLRPDSVEILKKHIRKLIDRLRRIQKSAGILLKYIWVAEVGSRGATHVHMVLNSIDIKSVRGAWENGYIQVVPLEESGQYRRLAEYLVKYSYGTEKAVGELIGHRYNPSRNLIKPEPEVRPIISRKKLPDKIRVPRGWYLDLDSVKRGIHEFTGYEYLYYTLVRIPGWKNNKKGGQKGCIK